MPTNTKARVQGQTWHRTSRWSGRHVAGRTDARYLCNQAAGTALSSDVSTLVVPRRDAVAAPLGVHYSLRCALGTILFASAAPCTSNLSILPLSLGMALPRKLGGDCLGWPIPSDTDDAGVPSCGPLEARLPDPIAPDLQLALNGFEPDMGSVGFDELHEAEEAGSVAGCYGGVWEENRRPTPLSPR